MASKKFASYWQETKKFLPYEWLLQNVEILLIIYHNEKKLKCREKYKISDLVVIILNMC